MQHVFKNIEEYNLGRKRKILIVFDDMVADMINNIKLNPVVIELFIRSRKLNISIVFITQPCFKVSKIKINKKELQQIARNQLLDVDFKDFMKIYKKYTAEPYLINDTTLPSDNPIKFRKNIFK